MHIYTHDTYLCDTSKTQLFLRHGSPVLSRGLAELRTNSRDDAWQLCVHTKLRKTQVCEEDDVFGYF